MGYPPKSSFSVSCMIVMPANNTGRIVKDLFAQFPDRIAILNTPNSWKNPPNGMPYAIDNGGYTAFSEKRFLACLRKAQRLPHPPIFVLCPDVWSCHDRTWALWRYYYPILRAVCDFPIAFAAQDGCSPAAIPSEADWIFVGGTDAWRSGAIPQLISIGRPVHVGRVNTLDRLQRYEELGVTSVDGSGWMRRPRGEASNLLQWFAGEYCQLPLF
jgi:hypothetical protein